MEKSVRFDGHKKNWAGQPYLSKIPNKIIPINPKKMLEDHCIPKTTV